MELSSVIDQFQRDGKIDPGKNWKQGRTAYGGLVVALMLAEIEAHEPDLPPLRNVQASFIGPASGVLQAQYEVLRRGKNTVIIQARLDGEEGIGSTAIFTFAVKREMMTDIDYPKYENMILPEDCPIDFTPDGAPLPAYIHNFNARLMQGGLPFSNPEKADFAIWFQNKDPKAHDNIVSLLALADAPPPVSITKLTKLRALSTMSWSLNFLSDQPCSEDGWWLIRSYSGHVRHGYSSQITEIYNRQGERVVDATQYIAIFE